MSAGRAPRRQILHVDMDAFFASVEQRDNPDLQGKPVIVGGSGSRGVVAAASYEARKFGVHSAMPSVRAKRLCPDAIFVKGRMEVYQSVSRKVFNIFRQFTPQIEGLSLDEAFLDVSGCLRLYGSAEHIAASVRKRIREELQLAASVGVASNKFLAKLASDLAKPDGIFVVPDDRIQAILDPLPVRRIWGIGKKAEEKLHGAGIRLVRDLRTADERLLDRLLGNRKDHFLKLCRGEDEREVISRGEDKSVSAEVTMNNDITNLDHAHRVLSGLVEKVAVRLRGKHLKARTVTVKIRRSDFKTVTRSQSMASAHDHTQSFARIARELLDRWWADNPRQPVRLLGFGVSQFETADTVDLFNTSQTSKTDSIADQIRQKFGPTSVRMGTSIGSERDASEQITNPKPDDAADTDEKN